MTKLIKNIAVFAMVLSGAVFIKCAPIRPVFEENPLLALLILIIATACYWVFEED